MLTRRQFIKAGIVGGVALAAAGAVLWTQRESHPRLFTLDAEQRALAAALASALLAGALPADANRAGVIEALVGRVEQAIRGLSASAQKELSELLALLTFAPARMVLAGVSKPWSETSSAQAAEFLQRWRFSRFALPQSAYHALHDLIIGAWYAEPSAWETIGYNGPPEVLL